MKKLTKGEVIALILAIAKKVAGQQATGISNITWNAQTNSLVFTMSDGSQINTPITLDASNIAYSNATSGLTATNIQAALDEINSKISSSGGIDLQNSEFVSEGTTDSWQVKGLQGENETHIQLDKSNQSIYLTNISQSGEFGYFSELSVGKGKAYITSTVLKYDEYVGDAGMFQFDNTGSTFYIMSKVFDRQNPSIVYDYYKELKNNSSNGTIIDEYLMDANNKIEFKTYRTKQDIIFTDNTTNTSITHTFDKDGLTLNGAKVLTETTGVKLAQGTENVGKILKVDSTGNLALADESGGINLDNSEFVTNYNNEIIDIGPNSDFWVANEDEQGGINKPHNIGLIKPEQYSTSSIYLTEGNAFMIAGDANAKAYINTQYSSSGGNAMLNLLAQGDNSMIQAVAPQIGMTTLTGSNTVLLNDNGFTLNNKNILTEDTGILKNQGAENAGKILKVNATGVLALAEESTGSLNLQYSEFGQNADLANGDVWKNKENTSVMAIEHTNTQGVLHRVEASSTESELQTVYNSGSSQSSVSTSSTGVTMSVIDTAGNNTIRLTPTDFTKNNVAIATTDDVYLATGNSIVLICNGTISNNEAVFTVENDSDYDTDLLVNGKEFEVDMNLAVAGDIPLDIPMYIQFKGYKTPIYNILVNNTTATVRDMLQLSKYENETGYRWIAKMRYILVSEPSAVRAFGIISTVTQQDIIRISNEDFLDYLTNGGLPQGQVALCDKIETGSSNGFVLGHLYKFKIVYGETNQYSWEDITAPVTTARISGNVDTYTVADAGTYIFFGDVNTLTITATEAVTITILGNLGTITLPETSATVLIHAVGYNGTFDTRPNSLKNGSVLGPYNIGRIDLA